MSTLHDLRTTLDRGAATVHDSAAVARVAAVRGRARAVRRRRTAVGAVAAALVVGGVSTVALLPRGDGPPAADRQLIGREAPETLTSLGYTYEFAEGVESGDGPASVRLYPADGARLVTWAARTDEVTLRSPSGERTWSDGTDFDDFLLVLPQESGVWSLRAGGADAAIVVYELGEERPPGVDVDRMTFRDRVGSDRLVDAVAGEVGDVDVSLDVTLPAGGLRLAEFCAGVPTGGSWWVNVEVGSEGSVSSGGCSDDGFDPGGSGQSQWLEPGTLGEAGETVTLRTWVSKRVDGPVADPGTGVRLGLGLYAVAEPAAVVAGWEMPELLEHAGHLWTFVGTEVAESGQGELRVRHDGARPRLAVGAYAAAGGSRVSFRAGPDGALFYRHSGGSGSDLRAMLAPGSPTARLRVLGEVSPRTRLGFALYERID